MLKQIFSSKKPYATFKEVGYDKAVDLTLKFYEKWVLPQDVKLGSLRDIKNKEFLVRRKLLNAYQKDQLLQSSSDAEAEKINKLAKITSIKTMYTFTHTTDRHAEMYNFRTHNFPKSYEERDTTLEYVNDPDGSYKMNTQRFPIKGMLMLLLVVGVYLRKKEKLVEEFDRQKRFEQRAMQNTEIEEFFNKKVKFQLYDLSDNKFTEKDLQQRVYTVFWYDAKMKNYLTFLEYLQKKKFIQANIDAYLIVDKKEYLMNIEKIKNESKDEKLKNQMLVLFKKQLSDSEQLLRTFSQENNENESNQEDHESQSPTDQERLELDLKKSFFYVINPEGRIIDCDYKIFQFFA
eukprot:403343668